MKHCYLSLIASVILLAPGTASRAQAPAATIAELRREIATRDATIADLQRRLAAHPGEDLANSVSSYNVALRKAQEDNDDAKADRDELRRWGWRGYNTVVINPDTGEQADPVQTRHLRETNDAVAFCDGEKLKCLTQAFDLLGKLHQNPLFDKYYVEAGHFIPLTNMEEWTDFVGPGGKTPYDLHWIELRDPVKPGH